MNTSIQLTDITSREKLSRLVTGFRNDILEGNINPLQAAAILKALEDFTKALRADILIKDATLQELERYAEKTVKFMGCTFIKKAVGTTYDFTNCNDQKLAWLQIDVDMANEKLKERQEFLKAIPAGGIDTFSQETGETFKLYPPVKLAKDGYSVTLSGE